MPDPRKFISTTDYPMPFLVYSAVFDFNCPAQMLTGNYVIAHGLPFRPLLIGQWSTSPNFQPSYDLAFNFLGFSGNLPTVTIEGYADDTNVHILNGNYTSTDQHIYCRLSAFAPPDYTGQVTAVDDTSPFRFNSDYNYMKIYMSGITTLEADTTQEVNHGLGYMPQCRIWKSIYGIDTLSPMSTDLYSQGLFGATISDQKLTLGNYDIDPFSQKKSVFAYQIYADGV